MKLEQLVEIAWKTCALQPELAAGPVVVGVSGGPDSLCLLDGLARLGLPLIAAHFDHHLRPDSARDAQTVQAFAAQLGVPFQLGQGDVAAYARQEQRSLEEAARILRYRFLFGLARSQAAQAVAVGHTADDQVETVLMHLLRGSGLTGLKGMTYRGLAPEWDSQIALVRPLLGFWRAETLAYCQEYELSPVFDASNLDLAFFRNRLRAELVPFLETFNPQARQSIWRLSQVLSGDAEIVQAAVQRAWEDCLDAYSADLTGQPVVLRLPEFCELLPGLQRGVLRRAIGQLQPGLRDVDFAAIERGLEFIHRPVPNGVVDLVNGLRLWVEGERLLIAGPGLLPGSVEWPRLAAGENLLPVPGMLDLPDGWRLICEWLDWAGQPLPATGESTPWEAWLAIDAACETLRVRSPQPGDRFQPLGMEGHSMKLSDFWINHKLPRRARSGWPLILLDGMIAWVPGFRPAHALRVTELTRRVLHLSLLRPDAP